MKFTGFNDIYSKFVLEVDIGPIQYKLNYPIPVFGKQCLLFFNENEKDINKMKNKF